MKSINIKALVLHAEQDSNTIKKYKHPVLSIENRVLHTSLSEDDIRVEILFVGLCGTDIHLTKTNPDTGFIISTAPCTIPTSGRIMGHEGIGRIIECGSNVKFLSVGDYVVLESIITCKHCVPCRQGNFNQCENAVLLGSEVDGLFCEIADIPASIAHCISKSVLSEQEYSTFACIEPASVAWLACETAKIRGGDSVLIFGGGPIGYFTAMICRLMLGVNKISLVEPSKFRRDLAKNYCDEVFSIEEFSKQQVFHTDIIIEASGYLSNVTQSLKFVNPNGRIILLARSGEKLEIDSVDHMITNSISIQGVRGHLGGAFQRVIQLVQSGKLPLDTAVTSVIKSLEDAKILLSSCTKNIEDSDCKILVKLNA